MKKTELDVIMRRASEEIRKWPKWMRSKDFTDQIMQIRRESNMNKNIHIIGGGTTFTVRPHLQLAAVAYGKTARKLGEICSEYWSEESIHLHLTRMATGGKGALETNNDISNLVNDLIEDEKTHIIFMTSALCDFEGFIMEDSISTPSGPDTMRLRSRNNHMMSLLTAPKIISKIRKNRKDIFLIGFKTTTGASLDDQYFAGLELLKKSSCNLVLANDIHTRVNMVITPEQSKYFVTIDRQKSLEGLVEMVRNRSQLTFTRSKIIPGDSIPWKSDLIPHSLRTVVDYCIKNGAYKPFLGSTVGHFAVKLSGNKFLTSKRKTNFNDLSNSGLVLVEAHDKDLVIAHGSKPSVGGQSQRIIFSDHPETDCIVHFHCPIKPESKVPRRSQKEYECGSHECGKNTSIGLEKFGNLWAVMLDKHGPNIVFNRNIDPNEVIRFIDDNFDLSGRTDEVKVVQNSQYDSIGIQ